VSCDKSWHRQPPEAITSRRCGVAAMFCEIRPNRVQAQRTEEQTVTETCAVISLPFGLAWRNCAANARARRPPKASCSATRRRTALGPRVGSPQRWTQGCGGRRLSSALRRGARKPRDIAAKTYSVAGSSAGKATPAETASW
jgi:hypothetical protein